MNIVSALLFLFVFLLLNAWISWNGSLFWSAILPDGMMIAYWIFYGVIALAYIAAMLLRRALPYWGYALLKQIGSYGLAFLFYALLLVPAGDLIYGVLRLAGVDPDTALPIAGWTASGGLLLLLLKGSWNAWHPIVRRYDIDIAKSGGAYRLLRVMVASDLHLGNIVGKRHLRRLVRKAEELKPDLILMPGDVLDDSVEPFVREGMAEVMRKLSAPLGVYVSLGNHEYYGGHIPEYMERMKAIGIEVLTDRSVLVADSFYVAGRKDKAAESVQNGRLPVAELLAGLDAHKPILLLDHQPYAFEKAAEAGADLMLSGHTHRGQMAPNHWITRRLFELDWGYMRKSAMHVIVSSGFGTWGPPVRIGSRSEVLDIRITFTG
ncbi:metallophosphoesterase [Paenibacillus aurantiacus]|uniref:Metallophosphoesterase n=1 Tax=Paenibacillus aurantiacus TaxID=1936118 RepID=A0ABV5KZL9_9BACL